MRRSHTRAVDTRLFLLQQPAGCSVRRPRHEKPCIDRKSTRLNSSHLVISYAVCCLKKKRARGIDNHHRMARRLLTLFTPSHSPRTLLRLFCTRTLLCAPLITTRESSTLSCRSPLVR